MKSEQVAATRVKKTQTTVPESARAVTKPEVNEQFPAKPRFDLISRHDSVQLTVSEQQPVASAFAVPVADAVGTRQVTTEVSSVASGPEGDTVIDEAQPMYWDNPLPEYPLQARRRHWEGEVWLRVNVSAAGTVETVELEKTSGYPVLDRSAERTVQNWKFLPARRAGVPVSCQVRVPVQFQLDES